MLLPPLVVGYGILTFAGFEVNIAYFLLSGLLLFIHTLFFMTLSLLLGVVFSSRTALLAGTLGILFGGQLLSGLIKFLIYIGPFALTQIMPVITLQGPGAVPGDLWISLVISFAWCLVFIVTAIWRINHLEF
jgi:hypothetical protein